MRPAIGDGRYILAAAVTLAELAMRIGCRVDGDETIDVRRVASLDDAGPGDVTFLHNPKYAARVSATRASAVIADDRLTDAPCAVLRSSNPYLAFAEAVAALTPPAVSVPGISPLASVAASATLAADVSIAPFACVGERARIGARVVIESHAVISADVTVGDGDDALKHRRHHHVGVGKPPEHVARRTERGAQRGEPLVQRSLRRRSVLQVERVFAGEPAHAVARDGPE